MKQNSQVRYCVKGFWRKQGLTHGTKHISLERVDNVRYIWTVVQIITQFVIGMITFPLATTYDPSLNGEPLTRFHSTWRTVWKFLKIWTRLFWIGQDKAIEVAIYMLWFNFILGLNFIFFCFWVWKCMIMIYKQKKIKTKPRIKLKHNTHTHTHTHTHKKNIEIWQEQKSGQMTLYCSFHLLFGLSIRRFWGKRERWKRKREKSPLPQPLRKAWYSGYLLFWAQLFEGRLALNLRLNLTQVSFSCV